MPQPVKPWKGIKNALAYGYVCPLLKQDEPNMEVLVPHRYWPQDEHCQNLNVWTQSLIRVRKAGHGMAPRRRLQRRLCD